MQRKAAGQVFVWASQSIITISINDYTPKSQSIAKERASASHSARFSLPAVVTIHSEGESNESTLRQVVTGSQDYPYSSSQKLLLSPEESICGVQSSRLGRTCDLRCVNCAKHRD